MTRAPLKRCVMDGIVTSSKTGQSINELTIDPETYAKVGVGILALLVRIIRKTRLDHINFKNGSHANTSRPQERV